MRYLEVDTSLLLETDEQRILRAVLRGFFAETCAHDDVREQSASARGYDETSWRRMAAEVGVQGLAIPERFGGSGYSFAELAVALEEAGRALAPSPLLPTVVFAATALLSSGDEAACARYLPRIADGSLTATVAGVSELADVRAERGGGGGGGGWVLRGRVDFVIDGQGADLVLVPARTADGGVRLFACEPAEGTCVRTARRVLDETRRLALVEFRGAPASVVGDCDTTAEILAPTVDRGLAALAVEQVGGARYALEATVGFVAGRRQFGRAIGSFQAVKHRLADLLVEVEAARSAAAYAVACAVGAPDEAAVSARVAAVVCSGAYQRAAAEYVQLHGGIGFTWEHAAHLYLRRARADEVLLGTGAEHRDRLADLLGLPRRAVVC
ncbi:MAG TPA: acyl-CoA dehydrogenase family protein [Actinospica sp.]|jgi:acyl-CoA dehydrogenase|nr:acyl-CoA dehydrogenase family protein [Actinospica sp.]